jgi:hypothetical protein
MLGIRPPLHYVDIDLIYIFWSNKERLWKELLFKSLMSNIEAYRGD